MRFKHPIFTFSFCHVLPTAALMVLAFCTLTLAAPMYSVTNLGNLGSVTNASGINDHGQVVGLAGLSDGTYRAFIWSADTGMIDLGTLPGDSLSSAIDINNAGQVVGYSQANPDAPYETRIFLWEAGDITDIGVATGTFGIPHTINESGQIVGQSRVGENYQYGAGFIYDPSAGLSTITIAGQTVTGAFGINNHGQMILNGSIFYDPNQSPIEIYDENTLFGNVLDVNDGGTVVGNISNSAYAWNQNTGLVTLTSEFGIALGINNLGQIVGIQSINGLTGGFLYEDGTLYDLGSLLDTSGSGWSNLWPEAINNHGQIVGQGTYDGQTQAFLLTPTGSGPAPEPESMALMGVGGAILLWRRGN